MLSTESMLLTAHAMQVLTSCAQDQVLNSYTFGRNVREGQRSASRLAGTGPLIVQVPSLSSSGV